MLRTYRDFERDEFVLIFADTSWGGGDYCAAQFLSVCIDYTLAKSFVSGFMRLDILEC